MKPARGVVVAVLLGVLGVQSTIEGRGAPPVAASPRSVTYPGRSMGTYVHVTVVTADSAATAPRARAALAVFRMVDSLMSNWTTTSEVARVNREASSGATPVHPGVLRVVETALRVWRQSDGAFDITIEPLMRLWGFNGGRRRVPPAADAEAALRLVGGGQLDLDLAAGTLRFARKGVQIDLGGIAKGYAVDEAVASLRAAGVRDALVDVSGNMYALGTPVGADHWRIGIRDPRDRIPFFARLPLSEEGISTSGKYEQFVAANGKTYGHIMDPRTGRPAEGLISVTVLAPTAMDADAWSTALFVLGPAEARRKAAERDDVAAVLVQAGAGGVDTVWVESTLRDRLVIEPAARTRFQFHEFGTPMSSRTPATSR